ncbi:permease [Gemmatirosa kalamazoonensis]|uniref:Permease n=1 Tax=Gemmatirosa kalamazoonensis TaxID=861299 RepID=W0RGI6_9BACT|nr:ABC transporter permease [Gemmatirosa kalamazoonensis]AHG89896.1 permease [Gemmatirosa kalamazoonensis]
MPPLGRFTRQLRARIWRVPVEREVDAEVAFHLEMRVAELIAEGMDPATAREAALRRFGDVAEITAACRALGRERDRAMRLTDWLAELRQDTRYALRHLRANPAFTAVAALTIALGIGTSTTVFGIVDAVLLRPLPFRQPEGLVRVWEATPVDPRFGVSQPNYLDWRARTRSFAELAAYTVTTPSVSGDGEPERLVGAAATSSLFRVLGVPPLLGRSFADEESAPGSERRVAILSYGLWQRRFAGDRGAVGRPLMLDGTPYTIVGVMPAAFDFPARTDLWLPLAPSPTTSRGDHRLRVVGRLAPGVTLGGATADMRRIALELGREYPKSNADWSVTLASFADWFVAPDLRARVLVLLGAVGVLLLMACVNVANLMLARATVRQRDTTLRAALGAGRGRVVRQLLTESIVLALGGAALGIGLAFAVVPALRATAADAVPRLDGLRVDWRVLTFGVVASMLTGLLFGLVPAVQASRANLHDLLRSGARVAAAGRVRATLIIASVAMTTLLLVGAGLIGTSFVRLARVDTGFQGGHVLAASIRLPDDRYPTPARITEFRRELVRRVSAVPGVTVAGTTNVAPFSGGGTSIEYTVVGRPQTPGTFLQADWRSVTPAYFAALGVPLLRGRLVDETDVDGGPTVLVISRRMADHVWPGEDPLGKQILVGGKPWTVVGVVGDIRDQTLEGDPRETRYLSYQQVAWPSTWLLVRTPGEPLAVANAVRRAVWSLDRTLPVSDVQPLSDLVSDAGAQPRFTALVFALFGAAALLLAVVGVYGIVAYGVAQQTREIGVRLALGARRGRILGRVVGRGVRLAGAGVALGTAASLALSRYLAGILFGVAPTDAATYVAVALVLVLSAALASTLPAAAAARLDPVRSLRDS